MKSLPNMKLDKVTCICSNFIYLPYLALKYNVCPYLSLLYHLNLPLFTYIWSNVALMTLIWSYLPLVALIWPYVPYSPQICIILLRLHRCAKFKSNQTITHGDMTFQRIGWYRKCFYEYSLGVYLVIDNFLYVLSDAFTVSNFKAIGQLIMEILHFKDMGSKCLPSHRVILQCIGNWQCYVTLKSSQTDTHTQTYR